MIVQFEAENFSGMTNLMRVAQLEPDLISYLVSIRYYPQARLFDLAIYFLSEVPDAVSETGFPSRRKYDGEPLAHARPPFESGRSA